MNKEPFKKPINNNLKTMEDKKSQPSLETKDSQTINPPIPPFDNPAFESPPSKPPGFIQNNSRTLMLAGGLMFLGLVGVLSFIFISNSNPKPPVNSTNSSLSNSETSNQEDNQSKNDEASETTTDNDQSLNTSNPNNDDAQSNEDINNNIVNIDTSLDNMDSSIINRLEISSLLKLTDFTQQTDDESDNTVEVDSLEAVAIKQQIDDWLGDGIEKIIPITEKYIIQYRQLIDAYCQTPTDEKSTQITSFLSSLSQLEDEDLAVLQTWIKQAEEIATPDNLKKFQTSFELNDPLSKQIMNKVQQLLQSLASLDKDTKAAQSKFESCQA